VSTLLGVYGHPDDETYLMAGIAVEAVRRGDRVVLVTATRGEEGSWDEEHFPTARMGEIRQKELEDSLEILGLREHHWLDYYDGTCAEQNLFEAEGKVRAIMEEVQPDQVFTFGPDGATNHPDHKAVSAWTTVSFAAVAPKGATLYYAAMPQEWIEKYVPLLNQFNVFPPGFPIPTPDEDIAIRLDLEGDVWALKNKAIAAHVSQTKFMIDTFGNELHDAMMQTEAFKVGARK